MSFVINRTKAILDAFILHSSDSYHGLNAIQPDLLLIFQFFSVTLSTI